VADAHVDTHGSIEAVFRIKRRTVAGLARYVRDIGLAEDLARDALVALEQWPEWACLEPGRLAHGHRQTSRHRFFRRNQRLARGARLGHSSRSATN
jgi:predicted RNA polymerase sigma factor